MVTTIDRGRLRQLMDRERERFRQSHPRSAALSEDAKASLLFGVPMNWMTRWPGDFPVFVERAEGARFTDVDGNTYVDFCLGDTGGMAGHAPKVAVDAIAEQAAKGITLMLPTEDAAWVGREMARRFGVPYWQFCLTATDANRFAIRWARQITGRSKVVVHNWCYHGSVDETFATLDANGEVTEREGNVGEPVPVRETTRVVEFNDVEGLERALADGDAALCLFEPALTNIGIVLPEPGYHDAVRELCTRTGTLLLIDETHTISAGPGGATQAWGLQPDIVTIGKTLGAGIPSAAYGFTQAVADRIYEHTDWKNADVGGVGGTLAGNALSLAAMRATLGQIMTEDAFARMISLGERFEAGVQTVIEERDLPWHVVRLGCRVEYLFRPDHARTGSEAAAGQDEEVDPFIHLYLLNRGVLMTPFHNMALMSPATTPEDVDRHSEVFAEMADELTGA
ncbi:MAG TPA: aspartate aminotransferase family protein [Actinomycetota bacterium]|nr:aspartate aminotransferase family protein [Actinomycetota bacterium]